MKAFEEKLIYSEGSRFLVADRAEESFTFEWHYHEAFEITLILEGEGQRFVGDSIEAYREGDFIFLPPGLPHTWSSSNSSRMNKAVYIQFEVDSLGVDLSSVSEFKELNGLLNDKNGFAIESGPELREMMLSIKNASGLERVIQFLSILKLIARSNKRSLSSGSFKPEKDQQNRAVMDKVMELMKNELSVKVPEIALSVGMSESSFRRFIKKNTGRSFIDFTNLLQISEACRLLIETEYSVSHISMECGYRNLSHFNRKFREYKNMTPREFRKSFNS